MTLSKRIDSIDVFRAVTMFLMIFVNDLWSIKNVPGWLEHSAGKDDAMGLADTVFPGFLFIVGLSIPFAISNRRGKGDDTKTIILHVVERFFALLIMGLFTVNLENMYAGGMAIPDTIWQILMVLGFLLIWNVYPENKENKRLYQGLKVLGYLLLVVLALLYKGGEAGNVTWMKTHWYGILGLIAWSYLSCALIYVWLGDRAIPIFAAWVFFIVFNIASFAGWLQFLSEVKKVVWFVGDGSMPGFVMAGIAASVIYRRQGFTSGGAVYPLILVGLGIACLMMGFGARPFWGISKIRATPAWLGICSGISFIAYAFLFWLVDMKGKKSWFSLLKPAGIATLTCYLVPYVWYAIYTLLDISYPAVISTGVAGIVKCLFFSFIIIQITGILIRIGIRLKI